MGPKFFNTKHCFNELKEILENKTSFDVDSTHFQNCNTSKNLIKSQAKQYSEYIKILMDLTLANVLS